MLIFIMFVSIFMLCDFRFKIRINREGGIQPDGEKQRQSKDFEMNKIVLCLDAVVCG